MLKYKSNNLVIRTIQPCCIKKLLLINMNFN